MSTSRQNNRGISGKSFITQDTRSTLTGGDGNDRLISSYQTRMASTPVLKSMVGYNGLGEEVRYTLPVYDVTLVGGGNFVDGGDGNDYIESVRAYQALTNGANTLVGGRGNDTIVGSYGDVLIGGEGVDNFKLVEFSTPGQEAITIKDFKAGVGGDKLDFSNYKESLNSVGMNIKNVFADGVLRVIQNGANTEIEIRNESWFGNPDSDPSNDKWTTAFILENVSASGFTKHNFVALGDRFISFYMKGSDVAEMIQGGDFNDFIESGSGNDTVVGGAGDDFSDGGTGNDSMTGGIGNDSLLAGEGNDILNGGDGNDFADGGTGNDSMTGGIGNDVLLAGEGNDILNGGAGNDILDGGAGVNIVDYSAVVRTLSINLGTSIASGDGNDTLRNIQNVVSGSGSDNIIGDSADNSLSGGAGNDTVGGGAGSDIVSGGNGNDSLNGGAGNDNVLGEIGNDTLIGSNSGSGTENSEIDTLTGGAGSDLFVLGTKAAGCLYDDGIASVEGRGGFALVADFTIGTDSLQLKGSASGYYLGASGVTGLNGIGLWAEQGATDELVAILGGANAGSLTTGNVINTAVFV